MYIAIEGVKGTGKTTLVLRLRNYFDRHQMQYELVCPTAPLPGYSLIERLTSQLPWLLNFESMREILYAHRSNKMASNVNWNAGLILGDRSIVTSYATRLWSGPPTLQIQRTDAMEPKIAAPDAILYLKADFNVVLQRIANRKDRKYGKEDERPERIRETLQAYEYLMTSKPARIKKTKWIIINADNDPNGVFENALEIINQLTSKSNEKQ